MESVGRGGRLRVSKKLKSTFEFFNALGEPAVLSLVKSVGEEAFLSCALQIEDVTNVTWERIGSDMAPDASAVKGVLRLPSISREDEGLYQCSAIHHANVSSSFVQLYVDDFVPVFFGQEYLELPPMNDDQLKNLDVIITVNSTGEDGVIFETTRRPSVAGEDPAINTRPPSLKHQARISNGLLVYEYDVGYGKESIASPIALDSRHWNTIHLRNNDSKAVLQLNSGPAIEKVHHPLRWQKGSNSPIILGAHIEANDRDAVRDGFKGSITAHEAFFRL
ncbi:unnamed protein product [Heligmosomoides polygyrus]|uniref:Ig-like domain-containing protein n=1 Tax=Heligmosomoides polygyrus TaxID=6339 RepID=A0A183F8R8_HELPZ|nr:unnamed protein product [Heligmosomoides polygyrus]